MNLHALLVALTASAAVFAGDPGGIAVGELLPVEREWLARIAGEPGGGSAVSDFETLQTFYEAPEIGDAIPDGNRVVLRWFEDGTYDGDIEIFIDGASLGSVPSLGGEGWNAVALSGVPAICSSDTPDCESNLGDCGLFSDRPGHAYVFEISAGDGFDACQEVLNTWPMAEDWRITCTTEEEDCEIIVEGETIGPPGTFVQIVVDGGEPEETGDFEEFTVSVPVLTRGDHEVVVRGYRNRQSAADDGLQWIHPETGVVYEGLAGEFVTHEIVTSCSTLCGEAPPGPLFLPGDCNASGLVDLSDAVFALGFLFANGEAPTCDTACETNGDRAFDLSDAVYTLLFLFSGGRAPSGWIDANGNDEIDDCRPGDASSCAESSSACG